MITAIYKRVTLVLVSNLVLFVGFSQSPGGISTGLTTWFKANTPTTTNLTVPVAATGKVSQWKSDVGTFTVSQATIGQQPVFTTAATTTSNFNFNPFIQFSKANGTVLYNAATTPDLIGTNGSVFVVVNTYNAITDGNPSGFTYKSNVAGYQFKPGFRLQTGDGISGGTGDFTPSATPNYNPAAGIILMAKGIDKNTTDRFFTPRRNGDSMAISHRYDLPNDGYSYSPSVPFGLFFGSDGTSTTGQNMSCGLAEVITFNTYLSEADQNKVETYLAVKYGLTLTASRLATIRSYRSATGTVIWDSLANVGYGVNITGIGRDTTSGLLQKQSQSVMSNALVFLYNGNTAGTFPATNVLNASSITVNNSFLLVGHSATFSAGLLQCASGNQVARMARVWKAQKTGTGIDTVTVAVNVSDVPATVKNLLVSTNPTFPPGATTLVPLQLANGKLYAAVRLNTGDYFTFGTDSLKINLASTTPTCTTPASGSITSTIMGGAVPYTYAWAPGGQTTANLTGVTAGTYTLTVLQGGVCPVTAQATIAPAILPTAPVVDATTICSGSTATLTILAPVAGYTYNWYTAATGGTLLTVAAPGTSFTTPALTAATTYYAEAISNSGCSSGTRTAVLVSLLQPLSQPVVTTASVGVTTVTFQWQPVLGAASYQVSVNGGAYTAPSSGATGTTHVVNGLQPLTTVAIRVVAVGSQSCQNSLAGLDTAKTLTNEIYIPNAFTPNGDGRNDAWLVYGNTITAIDVMIFNQWGQKIFETNTPNTGWDGTYKGKQQPVGVYVYVLKLRAGGTEIQRKGSINLVR